MKKFLSIFLAVAFVFSAMCMSVLATNPAHPSNSSDVKQGTYSVVGNAADGKTKGDYTDGLEQIDEKSAKGDITVDFTKDSAGTGDDTEIFEHRYAVDIVYSDLIIDLEGLTKGDNGTTYKFVWDVNQHSYVKVDATTNEVVENTNNAMDKAEIKIEKAFQLINHSDQSIYYKAEVSVDNGHTSYLNLGIDTSNNVSINGSVDMATIGSYNTNTSEWAKGEAKEGTAHTIIATPDVSWIDAINQLIDAKNEATGTLKVGALTITISSTDKYSTPSN